MFRSAVYLCTLYSDLFWNTIARVIGQRLAPRLKRVAKEMSLSCRSFIFDSPMPDIHVEYTDAFLSPP